MSSFDRALQFIELLRANRRISVKRLAQEMDVSTRMIYYMIEHASSQLPIRLESGIVILCQQPHQSSDIMQTHQNISKK